MNKWAGIRWSVHPLFVVVMLTAIVTGYFLELITLFLLVLVHELGHVCTAKGLGWRVVEVKLLPFGGVAVLDQSEGQLPLLDEALIVLAGPLQHVWMAGGAYWLGVNGMIESSWATALVEANMLLLLFNLLPAAPLDGGRLLQVLLCRFFAFYPAMLATIFLSLAVSAGLIGYAVFAGVQQERLALNLMLIGLFLLLSNWQSLRDAPYVFLRFLVHRQASEATGESSLEATAFTSCLPLLVMPSHTVQEALRRIRRGRRHLIYIVSKRGEVQHVVAEERLIQLYLKNGHPGRALGELFR